ncbi:MAG: cysteine desulfurase family protein [Chloroflexi bacterium]|nr:cysteine desulfurase family protein [Chloroflexota bacterium]
MSAIGSASSSDATGVPGGVVYLDSAASAPLRPEVLQAMLPYLAGEFGNPSAHHASGRRAGEAIEAARDDVALVLGAAPEEVIFTSGGTESINAAIKGVAIAQAEAGVGRHIVTTEIEHHAVLHSALYLERFGYEIELLPVDEYGRVSPEQVAAAIRPDTALVSIGYANNEVGTVQPLAEITAAVRRASAALGRFVPVHTDAVQVANTHPLDVNTLGVDLLSLSAHKFGGPKGMGLLYLRRGVPYLEHMSGGGQERQRRSGTENVSGIVGTALALRLAQDERDEFVARMSALSDQLRDGIVAACPSARLNGHPTERLPQSLHACFDDLEGETLVAVLDSYGIEASAGAACTSATWEPSHVLLAMGVPLSLAVGSLRMGLWPTLTPEHVDYVVRMLPDAVRQAREARTLSATP